MKYDFETVIDRHGHDAIAVDAVGGSQFRGVAPSKPKKGFDEIPMWVADMNFPTARSIQDAIIRRAEHPAFGYFVPSDEYYDAILYWHKLRKGVTDLSREDIGYENGVLGGVVSALKIFASPGDNVLLHSPTYMGFTSSVTNNGFHIVHSPLKIDSNGVWRMDYEDMDRKIRENHIHVAIFCNPHNPCGRTWSRQEILDAMDVYEKNNVWVIVDEIWSDLLMNGHVYTPVSSVSEWAKYHTVNFYAPSKTFNLAGLIGSYSVIYNKPVRERVQGISAKLVYNNMNVFSEHALIGAYSEEGNDWLNQLLPVLSENVNLAYDTITTKFKGVFTFRTEGTYMMFLDCAGWLKEHHMTQKDLLQKGWDYGIGWQDGHLFEGPDCIRLNLASPTHRIMEALSRMDKYVFNA
ncbi:MAG: aminotransferase class I/II-fold pyridoxal phosphate-dependent enzyme [Lachnospiraceae bacterium]|nr:aminotransferase class I/II-fold pyridoxal phosphate-dependent enzyme [Lachnospiraceae bacterium]MCH4030631.1 aminotransferase class I/II-fold pyridoxal phosphate-dependent enzyme [Lachnospiraceae bacterium]MCH4069840.1 aminotransferase class I/II-fold pyridoxal phosphate-dependent enzyme [Lachnospiraceae bacterium]MCH4107221.1 aminotransferase class I/II-fold pyridoxal phosphate-dependent enzyme [Lachnospiraceae bacterium]MCI1301924.1 aminotransferase class I/II-fold pyridoxal phosphate-dep